jgi:hypothetical protein
MGHFSMSCHLSGLPITGSTPACLILLKPSSTAKYVKGKNEYGTTHYISNEGTQVFFDPFAFPIRGKYDDYGGLEVDEDENTKILEKYFGLPIQDIINVVTSNRKDDGYDDSLKIIKKKATYPEDWIEGEKHFEYYQRITGDKMPFGNGNYPDAPGGKFRSYVDGKKVEVSKEQYDADFKLIHEQYARYQEWTKENPDPDDDYNKPQYEEKHKELLSLSGMWVQRDFYEKLTQERTGEYFDKLDMGTPQILEALGFKRDGDTEDDRYSMKFVKGKVVVHSDGTWMNIPGNKNGIYDLKDFKKYCESKGETLEIEEMDKKDRVEQIFDYIIPTLKKEDFEDGIDKLDKEDLEGLSEEEIRKLIKKLMSTRLSRDDYYDPRNLCYGILLKPRYGENKLSDLYLSAAMEGVDLKDHALRLRRFDQYMYACGKYYTIIGTSPQDGEPKMVKKMYESALSVLETYMADLGYDEDESEDEE